MPYRRRAILPHRAAGWGLLPGYGLVRPWPGGAIASTRPARSAAP